MDCALILRRVTSLLAFANQSLCDTHVPVVSYRARGLGAYHRGNCDSSYWLPTLTDMLVHKLLKLVKGGIAFDRLFTNLA